MSCFWGHEWKYADPTWEKYFMVDAWRNRVIKDAEGSRQMQVRACEKCGKAEKREIKQF